MVRAARLKTDSGIYHIMLRGINKQLILEDEYDKQKLKEVLQNVKKYVDMKYMRFSGAAPINLRLEKGSQDKKSCLPFCVLQCSFCCSE